MMSSGVEQQTDYTCQRTPVRSKKFDDSVCSPVFSQCTQEANGTVEVVWDWQTPSSSSHRGYKRNINQSPKLPFKRQLSNNQINTFDKLKVELETLKNQIVKDTDPETSEIISSLHKEENVIGDIEDVFNDSMEEELLKCSQEVEQINETANYLPNDHITNVLNNHDQLSKETMPPINMSWCAHKKLQKNFQKPNLECDTTNSLQSVNIADDSFELILQSLKDEDIGKCHDNAVGQEITANPHSLAVDDSTVKCTIEEIEQKRLQAIAKLEAKKKQSTIKENSLHIAEDESPTKCSPEEIEQKRLQALAKLKEKKKFDIIERNRLLALERLKEKKKRVQETNVVPKLKK